jgi:DNA-binding beta-propeller fold protein YncE
MAMGDSSVHKLRPVLVTKDNQERERRDFVGHIIAVNPGGKAVFVDEAGEETVLVIARRVDRCWLKAAVALAPVPAVASHLGSDAWTWLSDVFPAPEHEALDDHFRVDAKTIELSASESICIRTGKSIVTVTAAGEVTVRGRNITSRASNLSRVRGGVVKIN